MARSDLLNPPSMASAGTLLAKRIVHPLDEQRNEALSSVFAGQGLVRGGAALGNRTPDLLITSAALGVRLRSPGAGTCDDAGCDVLDRSMPIMFNSACVSRSVSKGALVAMPLIAPARQQTGIEPASPGCRAAGRWGCA